MKDHFSTSHLLSDLSARSVRGTAITAIAQALKVIIQIASISILAHLLKPEDFGLVAMVTVVTGLLAIVKEGGLSMATVQRPQLTQDQVSALFWVNIALGFGLTLFVICLAPLLSSIYKEPKLTTIAIAISATFLIDSLSIQHKALLSRQMRFRELAFADVISMGAGLMAGVVTAWFGLGYWALVMVVLVSSSTLVLAVWILNDWRPDRLRKNTGVRPLLSFGVYLSAANIFAYVSTNTAPFLIGLVSGAQQLGFYNRASALASLPSNQVLPSILSVAEAALARISLDDDRFRRVGLSLIGKLLLVASFLTASMLVMADWLVEILLGSAWVEVVPIFRMLALFTIVEPVASLLSKLLIARGRADAYLKWRLISLAIIIVSLSIGILWGEMGIVIAYSMSGLFIRLPLFIVFASHYLPISAADFARTLFPYLGLVFCLVLVLFQIRRVLDLQDPWFGLIVMMPVAMLVYVISVLSISTIRHDADDAIRLVRSSI